MRKVLGIAAGLAAMTLAGCQSGQQPRQDSMPQSVLDVKPAGPAQDGPYRAGSQAVARSTSPRYALPVQTAVPPDEPAVAIAEPAVSVTPTVRPNRKRPDEPTRVASRKASAGHLAQGADAAGYKVKKGDTLYGIARNEYGDGKKWTLIASANPGLSPQSLKTGQTIVIP
ncbi:MAG TPA: LysM peptidoglycan-binding domain-containing protein [Tepidisphaeraceae bacterium]|jgi:nucleoid-associated protein YgaU|nr:LysM peptidoglycan-binding domain-containing protein [Tepidisphaeraceae bacterium]